MELDHKMSQQCCHMYSYVVSKVTITPGSLDQISLVLWLLQELQLPEVRVGAQEWPKNADKKCIKGKFYDSFGRIPEESIKGHKLLHLVNRRK